MALTKILHIQRVKSLAGSEKWLAMLLPELGKHGYECELVVVCRREERREVNELLDLLEKKGVKYWLIESPGNIRLRLLRQIYKIYNEGNFQAIHSHLIHADLWCAVIKKFIDSRLMLFSTVHGYEEEHQQQFGLSIEYPPQKNKYYHLVKFSLAQANAIHAVSQGLNEFFVKNRLTNQEKITVIRHGLDTDNEGIAKDEKIWKKKALVVGRVIPYKGHEKLINAFASVVKSLPDAELIILGGGQESYIEHLQRLCKSLGISKHVHFKGFQNDVSSFYREASVLVVPSIGEGFGMVFLEGMLQSLPIVAFDVPASNEIVEHGKTGYLVPSFEEEKMADAIIKLMNDEKDAYQKGKAGRERLEQEFKFDRQVRELVDWYKRFL